MAAAATLVFGVTGTTAGFRFVWWAGAAVAAMVAGWFALIWSVSHEAEEYTTETAPWTDALPVGWPVRNV